MFRDGVSSNDDRAGLGEGELQAEEDTQLEAATRAALGQDAREEALLDEMTQVAEAA